MKATFTRITLRSEDLREYERVKKTWEEIDNNAITGQANSLPSDATKSNKNSNTRKRIGLNSH